MNWSDLELALMDLLVIITMQLLHDFRSHPAGATSYVTSTRVENENDIRIKNNDMQINGYRHSPARGPNKCISCSLSISSIKHAG